MTPKTDKVELDPNVGWEICSQFYNDFKLQLIEFPLSHYTPSYDFKNHFINYINGEPKFFFKYMWFINDYYRDKKFNFPTNIIWHQDELKPDWRPFPGIIKYNLYHLDNRDTIPCLYQPVYDFKFKVVEEYSTLQELMSSFNIPSTDNMTAWLRFRKYPFIHISAFPGTDLYDHLADNVDTFKELFLSNTKNGIYYKCNSKTQTKIQREIASWPEQYRSLISFVPVDGPSIEIEKYEEDSFYLSMYLAGTHHQHLHIKRYNLTYFRNLTVS